MYHTILNHRSIRKYKNTPIDENLLNQILEAGIRASNTGNMQAYSMVVTRDKDVKDLLWECHFKQDMVKEAPVIITFCADLNRFHKWCRQRNANPAYNNFLWFYNASIDAVLASQNICLAAEARDLGICYLGTTTYMADKIIDILNLPSLVVPVTSIVMGYPGEVAELTDRLPLEGVIHNETYKQYTTGDIDSIYEDKDTSEETKELLEINKKETLAQIFTDIRYKKSDNELFSEKYLNTIKSQGFSD